MPKLKARNYQIKNMEDFAKRYPQLVDHVPASYKPRYGKIDYAIEIGMIPEGLAFDQECDVAPPSMLKKQA